MGLLQSLRLQPKLSHTDVEKIFFLELKTFLHKIYSRLGKDNNLDFACPELKDIKVRMIGLGDLAWTVALNPEKEVAKGKIGRIMIRADHASITGLRKWTAAHLAAELFIYHLYARRGRIDEVKDGRFFSKRHVRAKIIRHILASAGELRYEHVNVMHIQTVTDKTRKIDLAIADELRIAESDFKKIGDQLNTKKLSETGKMDLLVAAEEDEIRSLLDLVIEERKLNRSSRLTSQDEAMLRGILSHLRKIREDNKIWAYQKGDRKDQLISRKITLQGYHNLLDREKDQEKIDIYVLHTIFEKFEEEKARIIGELSLAA